jgi:hypothetical protein
MNNKIFLIAFLISFLTFAEEPKIISIGKGIETPYEGILLNKEAAVSLKVELDTSEEKCNLLVNKQVELSIATCDYEKSILINKCEKDKTDLNIKLNSLNQELLIYNDKVKESENKVKAEFWSGTIIGAAGSVLVTSIIGLGIYIFK